MAKPGPAGKGRFTPSRGTRAYSGTILLGRVRAREGGWPGAPGFGKIPPVSLQQRSAECPVCWRLRAVLSEKCGVSRNSCDSQTPSRGRASRAGRPERWTGSTFPGGNSNFGTVWDLNGELKEV